MNGAVYSKLEIDVMQVNEIQESVHLAIKHKLPAIVVHQSLSGDAIIARSMAGGKFKIITPVDWPKGEIFGDLKLRGLSFDSIETDGFEILLTAGKNETDTKNEAKVLTEFLKSRIGDQVEVRFVLGSSLRPFDHIETICKSLAGVRTPTCIRTDTQLKTQVTKANPEEHNKIIAMASSYISAPIKVSGNINTLKAIASCPQASKFAVNLLQAKAIIKELQNSTIQNSTIQTVPNEAE
jgi:hypothetical protein